MRAGARYTIPGLAAALALAVVSAHAASPVAAINASPESGRAPLGVLFDASPSSADIQTFLWEFGDGAASTAESVTHIYTVAGTYVAKLTVTNAAGATASAQITITVTGSSAGPVTGDMNFRWAITSGSFVLRPGQENRDALSITSVFNTVDLPPRVDGLAASFSINNSFTISGVLNSDGVFVNPDYFVKPTYTFQLSVVNQLLTVFISKAQLEDALTPAGEKNATVIPPGLLTPVTFFLTIGAETYSVTENFAYTAVAGVTGRGSFNLLKGPGAVGDGFFVIARASALENGDRTGHFFEFDGYLSRPLGLPVQIPGKGAFVFKFHDADRLVLPFDRLRQDGPTMIRYRQPERGLGGLRSLLIDTQASRITIRTWDLPADPEQGGTGLPLLGQPYLSFNFAVRLELDQPDGTVFQTVTATTLVRHTKNDAFWQTGRRR